MIALIAVLNRVGCGLQLGFVPFVHIAAVVLGDIKTQDPPPFFIFLILSPVIRSVKILEFTFRDIDADFKTIKRAVFSIKRLDLTIHDPADIPALWKLLAVRRCFYLFPIVYWLHCYVPPKICLIFFLAHSFWLCNL